MEDQNLDSYLMAYQVNTRNYSLPLTLEIQGGSAVVPIQQKITFDIGEDPFRGPWEIDQTLDVAGHALEIISADAATVDGYPGFEDLFETDGQLSMPSLDDEQHPIYGAGGGPRGESRAAAFILYENRWPTGKIQLLLADIKVPLEGEWSAVWQ